MIPLVGLALLISAPPTGTVVVDVTGLPPAPSLPAPIVVADTTRELFAARCAQCHGVAGRGDGVLAPTLNPKARNFTDLAWQAAISDETIAKTIREGGAAMGKSPLMPPNPDLAADAALLAQLVAIVRSFGERGPATVRMTLERVDVEKPVPVAEKRLRLKAGGLRARFEGVAPCKARVVGYVDLDGDGAQAATEPAFAGAPIDVGAGEAKCAIALPAAAMRSRAEGP